MPRGNPKPGAAAVSALVERAFTRLDQGKLREARADFDEVLRRDPTNGRAFFGRGRAHYDLKRFAAGLDDLEQARECQYTTVEVYRYRGYCRDDLYLLEEAVEDLGRVIEQLPNDAAAFHRRANALQNLDQHEAALADYDRAIELEDTNVTFNFLRRAEVLYELGRTEEALADLEQGLRCGLDQLEDANWCYSLADFWKEIQPEAALQLLAAGIRKEPESEPSPGRKRERKKGDAFTDFDQVLPLEPRNGRAFLGRARFHFWNDDYEAALDDLERAQKCKFTHAEFYRVHGQCHNKLELYQEALEDFDRLIQLLPDDADAFLWRGQSRYALEQYAEALADLDRSLQLDHPAPAGIILRRSQTLQQLGRSDEAQAELERGLACRALPDANCCHELAHSLEEEQPEAALRLFAEAIRKEPDAENHHSCRASLLRSLGREEEADDHDRQIEQIESEEDGMDENKTLIAPLVREHHNEAPLAKINVTVRRWPWRAGADMQRAFDSVEEAGFVVKLFHATEYCGEAAQEFTQVYKLDRRDPVLAVPPKYLEIDIGEKEPVPALKDGVWLLEARGTPLTVMLNPDYNGMLKVQVAAVKGPKALKATHDLFHHIENTVRQSACYRGKVLSLDEKEMYSGEGLGILVHKLKKVRREQVILPPRTVDLLDRNVMEFVAQRPRLAALGQATKKGLLFYGPPGTGKTHTIHYLTNAMPGHTTFLIAAEQVFRLTEYLTLARLLQPSIVVIEDVDLIARERTDMREPGEEVLLNKLLNEMDGLQPDAEVLFILTTNRPEALEEALAARPGRIDQAIEFPLPDAEGRAKLVRLYARGVKVPDGIVDLAVERTDKVSASFIKELMRRAIQFALMRSKGKPRIVEEDVESALEEMLVTGGSLNRKLLGAVARDAWTGEKESRNHRIPSSTLPVG
jgi:tetratricopeptide (TPR) repeat protein